MEAGLYSSVLGVLGNAVAPESVCYVLVGLCARQETLGAFISCLFVLHHSLHGLIVLIL